MRKWVDSIVKILKRKVESSLVFQGISQDAEFSSLRSASAQFNEDPPTVEWFVAQEDTEKYDIMTVSRNSG